jgi:hypothetical protein
MATDKEIKNMHDAKIQRWDNSGVSAQIGGLLHDVINIITSDNYPPIDDPKKTAKEIKEWLDILYEIMEDKKNKINEVQKTKLIEKKKKFEEMMKWQEARLEDGKDENDAMEETMKWQEKYSELEAENNESKEYNSPETNN